MAFTGNFTCNVFKSGLIAGEFNFAPGTADVFRIALYTNAATLNQNTTAYTTTGEVVAPGYTAGGNVLTPTVGGPDETAFISFANTSWSGVIMARGALIYKDGGAAICVLDFGADRTSATAFQVQFPPASVNSAIIRLS
jgi:hypothetical protein